MTGYFASLHRLKCYRKLQLENRRDLKLTTYKLQQIGHLNCFNYDSGVVNYDRKVFIRLSPNLEDFFARQVFVFS